MAFALEEWPSPEAERLELFSEELAVAMSPRHVLAGERPLPVSRLAGHPLRTGSGLAVPRCSFPEQPGPRIAFSRSHRRCG